MKRKTVILTHELKQYNIDIAALSETHLTDEGQISKIGVGFAIKTSLLSHHTLLGISDQIMTLRFPLSKPDSQCLCSYHV